MSENNKPVEVLRDGNLKAAVFRNEGEKGPFFSVSLSRTYTDERGQYHDSNVLSGTELLRGAELLRKSYDVSRDLKKDLGKSGELFQERSGRDDRHREPRARETHEGEGRASEAFETRRPRTRNRELNR